MYSMGTFQRQTIWPIMLGSIACATGITVLAWAISSDELNTVYGMMALSGFGVGIRMSPATIHGLAYFPANTAAIECIFAFAFPFGGTVGLTIMNSVFNNKVGTAPTSVNAKGAIMYAFYAIVPFMWLCVILATFLGNTWINEDGKHEIVNGAYLWSLVTRKQLVRETRTRGSADWTACTHAEAGAEVEAQTATRHGRGQDRTLKESI